MEIVKTPLAGCVVIHAKKFGDDRGFFMESYHKQAFQEAGISFEVKQINFAKSEQNVLRGLHFQKNEYAQAKFVGVISGSVMDVVVDCRKESPTYLAHFKIVIDQPDTFLLIPRGFAHGYYTLADHTVFHYAVDNFYTPDQEGGIRYDDPKLNIDWELTQTPLVSQKDLNHKFL
ncbi:MAG: dTDP-4-dehydrorhamnose 3,5-epimerase [Cyclobacteriaceae bacterium]|nr:dTDP-4-dehydrorhamnose 3,5-epimerase [Cyclobacteriaceae bacterium]